jgi:hypothetical protein
LHRQRQPALPLMDRRHFVRIVPGALLGARLADEVIQ